MPPASGSIGSQPLDHQGISWEAFSFKGSDSDADDDIYSIVYAKVQGKYSLSHEYFNTEQGDKELLLIFTVGIK